MSSAARAELKSGEGSSGETIATVAQTTDFCKTLSWREVYANSLVALGPGPEKMEIAITCVCDIILLF